MAYFVALSEILFIYTNHCLYIWGMKLKLGLGTKYSRKYWICMVTLKTYALINDKNTWDQRLWFRELTLFIFENIHDDCSHISIWFSLSEGAPLGSGNVWWEGGSRKMKQNLGPLETTRRGPVGWIRGSAGTQGGAEPRRLTAVGLSRDKESSSKEALFPIHHTTLISES